MNIIRKTMNFIEPPRQGIIGTHHDNHEVKSHLLHKVPSSSSSSSSSFYSKLTSERPQSNQSGKSSEKSQDVRTPPDPPTQNDIIVCFGARSRAQSSKNKSEPVTSESNAVVSSKPKPVPDESSASTHSTTSHKTNPPKSLYHEGRRKVRFNEYDEIQEIASAKDFSQTRKERLWFTGDEMDSIRGDCRDAVNLANEGELIEELGGIYGLEKHTKALNIQMKEVTHRCIDTVLDIQEVKRKIEKKDFAAKMYFLLSAKATLDAHVYASELANEVKDYSK